MELDIPRVWVMVTPRLRPDGGVALEVEDSSGADGRATATIERTADLGPGRDLAVHVPVTLRPRLDAALERLDHWRVGASRPSAVPVFVRPPTVLTGIDWRSVVLEGVADADRFVILESRPSTPQPPLHLPLGVVAVGDVGRAAVDFLLQTRNPWFTERGGPAPSTVRRPRTAAAVRREIAADDVDLLLIGARDAERLVIPKRGVVRLLVVIGDGPAGPLDAAALPLRGARSVLRLPRRPSTPVTSGSAAQEQLEQVGSILYALSHDLPLQDAVREAVPGWTGAGLSASPESLHDLRLVPIWQNVERRVVHLEGKLGRSAHTSESYDRWLSSAVLAAAPSPLVPEMADISFLREIDGLHPLRNLVDQLDAVDAWVSDAAVETAPRADVPDHVPRVVNLGVQRGVGTLARGAVSTYVDANRSLSAHSSYTLEVQIGAPSLKSIVVGEPVPIDGLLPDSTVGHRLTVTVFTDSLDVHGPTSKELDLPLVGASESLRFDITTRVPGKAWLRLSIYHRGNLVQTYRVRTRVAAEETVEAEPALTAVLEHTSTERWDDLESLTPRALSITLNADDEGRHRLFVKARDLDELLPLDASALAGTVGSIRAQLNAVVNATVSAQASSELARTALVQLARLGSDVYFAVFGRSYPGVTAELLPVLDPLKSQVGVAVQVTRADIHQVVPWGQLYDWDIAEAGPVETCFGRGADGEPCTHGPDDGVACVNGFWGVRLLLEELLPEAESRVKQRSIDLDTGAVLSLGVTGDAATIALASELTRLLPPGRVRDLTPQDTFLDAVFDPERRPGLILVLGGYETGTSGTSQPHDRIKVPTTEDHLTPNAILKRLSKAGPWNAPARPLVFLLSCGSSGVRRGDLTSFLSALVTSGAAAIIGTQCDVYTSLARTFTVAVLARMKGEGYASTAFGQAVHEARRDLLMNGDVRALAFDAFGPAELTLA